MLLSNRPPRMLSSILSHRTLPGAHIACSTGSCQRWLHAGFQSLQAVPPSAAVWQSNCSPPPAPCNHSLRSRTVRLYSTGLHAAPFSVCSSRHCHVASSFPHTASIACRPFSVDTGRYKFVDKIRLEIIGGSGGKGLVSYESIDNIKKRPIGGHGGKGGDVVIESSQTVRDLNFQTYVIRGRDGGDATGKGNNGKAGKPKRIMVPVGTIVKEVQRIYKLEEGDEPFYPSPKGEQGSSNSSTLDKQATGSGLMNPHISKVTNKISRTGIPYQERLVTLADLDQGGQQVLIARGGLAGQGNKGTQLTYAETTKGVHKPHTKGFLGEVRNIELELKGIADVGLVGFPNAGKSSFLCAVSKAKPKVADYPFTTLHPTVGTLHFRDAFDMTIADIPGLIEGAHADRGLGHDFLRHIERTKVLLYVLDASGFTGDPVHDLKALQQELKLYDPALPRRPSLVLANKMDLPGAEKGLQRLRESTSLPVLECSAAKAANLPAVLQSLRWLLEASERAAEKQKEEALERELELQKQQQEERKALEGVK